ncbi:MAG: hypothetical protein K2J80_05775 [Oscillospiraceae bacterium]|nr:hypothetical protein [Oscillospiraceae bacterium]
MTRFDNKLCPVCRTRFVEKADVVVCPICGTPHHRACYSINNKCALEHLHADGWNWNGLLPDEEEERREMSRISPQGELGRLDLDPHAVDPHHAEYPAGTPQAPYEEEQRMFEEQLGDDNPFKELFRSLNDKEICAEGVRMKELVAYSATSAYHYGKAFQMFRGTLGGKKRKVSLNLCSGLLAPMFQGYRRMNVFGVLSLLLLMLPSFIAVILPEQMLTADSNGAVYLLQFVNITIRVLLCVFGDYIYYRHCVRNIKKFRKAYDGDTKSEDYYMALYECGKPTLAGAAVGCLALMFGSACVNALAKFI